MVIILIIGIIMGAVHEMWGNQSSMADTSQKLGHEWHHGEAHTTMMAAASQTFLGLVPHFHSDSPLPFDSPQHWRNKSYS
jgi:hypothetical protein